MSLGQINLIREHGQNGMDREFKDQNSHDLGRRGRVIRPTDPWFKKIPRTGVVGGAFDFPNEVILLKIFLDFIVLRYINSYNDLKTL